MNAISIDAFLKSLLISGLILVVALASGCSTLSKGECLEADWYEIGAKDGASGKPRSRLNDHRESCAEYDVFPDREQYYMGREEGIQIYCTPANGYKQGYEGNFYSGTCPVDLESAFLSGYNIGREIYDEKRKAYENERKIDQLEKELAKKDTTQQRRKELREEIRSLDQKNRDLRDEINYLERRARARF